jgi:hypothetical protein
MRASSRLLKPAMLLAALVLVAVACPAQSSPVLSPDASISLLTLWPGNEIYLAFGHSAFRVRDPARNIDTVFNYGTFDFSDPLFVPKFVKGYLNYYLAFYSYARDLSYDKKEQNREWYEQVLNLDNAQVNALYAFLVDNARVEKRYYRYDFILDNCATRIRDALITVLGSEVRFDPSNSLAPHKSYRQMIDDLVVDRPLYRFMFFIVLGMASDKDLTSFESQFLPLSMMQVFQSSFIMRNGTEEPLVRSAGVIYSPPTTVNRGKRWADPAYVIWPLALIVLFFFGRNAVRLRSGGINGRRRAIFRTLDALLFFILGLMGCLVFYLTFFSVHAATQGNLNVLWLLPTNLIAAFFLLSKKGIPPALAWYFLAVSVLCLVPLLAWPLWPQRMHPTMIPLLLMISARALWIHVAARKAATGP